MKLLLWVLSVGGALGAAYGLYHLEHEVKTMERALSRVDEGTRRDGEAIQVLQAEWSYLNRPERLQELSSRHLTLTPSLLKQIATPTALAELPRAVMRPAEDAHAPLPVELANVPIPVPKPSLPSRRAPVPAAVPAAPQPMPATPTPKAAPMPGMTVAAAFRVEDIVIKGRP